MNENENNGEYRLYGEDLARLGENQQAGAEQPQGSVQAFSTENSTGMPGINAGAAYGQQGYTQSQNSASSENGINNQPAYTPPPYNSTYNPQPAKPPKKKKHIGAAIAAVLAVVMLATGAGFGGSYLANTLISSNAAAVNDGQLINPDTSENEEPPATTTEYHKPDVPVDDSLSTLANMAQQGKTNLTLEELFEKVSPSIVLITNYQYTTNGYSDYFGYDEGSSEPSLAKYATGSGIVITSDGYIITNAHVINGAEKVSVTLDAGGENEKEIDAVIVGSDTATDLAVLKISTDQPLTPAPLGDSDSLKVGQSVCAIGNPSGLNNTLTNGIISGLNRYYSTSSIYELSSIQTNAAINPGNSGGGLFDMKGNVVGVVNAKIVSAETENLGFAITINDAKPVISDLINHGHVTGRPQLGITIQEINEYAAFYLYDLPAPGLLVSEINPDAPVARSGLRIGDVIVGVNGQKITTLAEVQNILKDFKAGDTVTLIVSRTVQNSFGYNNGGSETVEIKVELIES